MRKLVALFFVTFLIVSCTKKDQARIKLQVAGLENKTAIFQEQRVEGAKILDTLTFSGSGKLNYKLSLRQTGFYNLIIPEASDIYFVLSPNDKIKIEGRINEKKYNLEITGSPETEMLNKLYDSLFATRKILDKIRKEYQSSEDAAIKEKLYNEYVSILDSYRKYSMQFVLDNLTSISSVAALYQEIGPGEFVFGRRRDLQFFKLVNDSLTKYYPKQRHVLALKRNFGQMMESYQMERLLSNVGEVKTGLPNLELPSISGKTISLESMKERYVLLNFWQHTDEISSRMFPEMNSTFKKFNSKGFGIYNVYLGKSTSMWQSVVKFEEITNWTNVADTSFPYSQTRMMYNIVTIPSNYLIDLKDKEIIGKDLNPNQLNQTLSDLVK